MTIPKSTLTLGNQQGRAHTKRRTGRAWTAADDALLETEIPAKSVEELADRLGRTPKAIYHRAYRLGKRWLKHPDRFWAMVTKTDTCWLWEGVEQRAGHGYYDLDGRRHQAHRMAYEMAHGPIPADHHLHHLCHTPACVNPAHLQPVHKTEHVMLHDTFGARKAAQTVCKHGHEFTPENTYICPRGYRVCRTCRRAYEKAHRAYRKAA